MQQSSQPNIGNAVKGDFHPLLPPHRGRTVRVAVEDLAKSQCAEHSVALWAHEGSGADIRGHPCRFEVGVQELGLDCPQRKDLRKA